MTPENTASISEMSENPSRIDAQTVPPQPGSTQKQDDAALPPSATSSPEKHASPGQAQPAYAGHLQQDVNLVLEGGGMRCMFTAGVLDFFMEQGLVARQVIGVSAGALTGMLYTCGVYGLAALMNLKYCGDDRYISMRNLLQTGNVVGREFVFHDLLHDVYQLDPSWFANSPIMMTSVASNLETGEADYHTYTDFERDLPYLIASSSLPLVSEIVEIDGKKLLDGGTCDSIPFEYSFATGASKHIVVLTRDAPYVKGPNKLMKLIRALYADYPYFVDCAEHRHFVYNRQHRKVAELHREGKLFMLQPQKPVEVRVLEHDQDALLDLYAKGYQEAAENWGALQRYLEA